MIDFQAQLALDDFALNFHAQWEEGVNCLFGPSGSGKTLATMIMSGLRKADSIELKYQDSIIESSSQNICVPIQERKIGFVFQNPLMFPHLNTMDNIRFASRGRDLHLVDQECSEILKMLKIENCKNKYSHELSGGQAKRVCIARTLVNRPDILILDEPFSGLDMPLKKKLREDIKNITQTLSLPTILISHDLLDVLEIGNNLTFMLNGQNIQDGPLQSVISNPINKEVETFLDLANYKIK